MEETKLTRPRGRPPTGRVPDQALNNRIVGLYNGGVRIRDIAEMLSMTPGAVGQRLRRIDRRQNGR